jgi:hypothetical protein
MYLISAKQYIFNNKTFAPWHKTVASLLRLPAQITLACFSESKTFFSFIAVWLKLFLRKEQNTSGENNKFVFRLIVLIISVVLLVCAPGTSLVAVPGS